MARFDRIPKRPVRQPAVGPWKHGRIPVFGLIGGIGAGKSLVASLLAERGALVLDADAIGHALLDQRPARDQVVARFGAGILAPRSEGEEPPAIDRRALGAIVFADPAALRSLENILHPRMRRTFEKAIDRALRRGKATAVVLDAAILLEKGWDTLCDRIIYVDAPHEQRLARLTAQRGWTAADLETRERAQWPAEAKRKRATLTVENDADLSELAGKVARAWSELMASRPRSEPRRAPRSQASTDAAVSDEQSPAVPTGRARRRPGPRRRPSREGFRP
ncbi:MAG: dephospho-CoA kinase [Isosphaeraceae bacterium]|nr:dephospho-CoA kinase [Isosphaeraceae bacterium]